eukprot:m.173696 g.173696  ORF g.173696 m.173696 type:complete len:882 (+) comp17876_c0_seq4:380-3025(+)
MASASRAGNGDALRAQQLLRWRERNAHESSENSSARRSKSVSFALQPGHVHFEGGTLLLAAASAADASSITELLAGGKVNPDASNADGMTALHQASIDNRVDVATLLLDAGGSVDARDNEMWTPLHAAASCGNIDVLQLLLDRGADLLALNVNMQTSLDLAIEAEEDGEDAVEILEKEMARRGLSEVNAIERRKQWLARLRDDAFERAESCQGISDRSFSAGATLLHVCCAHGLLEAAEALIHSGAELDARDDDNWTPLHAAVAWGHPHVVRYLASLGSDVTAQTLAGEKLIDLVPEDDRTMTAVVRGVLAEAEQRKTKEAVSNSVVVQPASAVPAVLLEQPAISVVENTPPRERKVMPAVTSSAADVAVSSSGTLEESANDGGLVTVAEEGCESPAPPSPGSPMLPMHGFSSGTTTPRSPLSSKQSSVDSILTTKSSEESDLIRRCSSNSDDHSALDLPCFTRMGSKDKLPRRTSSAEKLAHHATCQRRRSSILRNDAQMKSDLAMTDKLAERIALGGMDIGRARPILIAALRKKMHSAGSNVPIARSEGLRRRATDSDVGTIPEGNSRLPLSRQASAPLTRSGIAKQQQHQQQEPKVGPTGAASTGKTRPLFQSQNRRTFAPSAPSVTEPKKVKIPAIFAAALAQQQGNTQPMQPCSTANASPTQRVARARRARESRKQTIFSSPSMAEIQAEMRRQRMANGQVLEEDEQKPVEQTARPVPDQPEPAVSEPSSPCRSTGAAAEALQAALVNGSHPASPDKSELRAVRQQNEAYQLRITGLEAELRDLCLQFQDDYKRIGRTLEKYQDLAVQAQTSAALHAKQLSTQADAVALERQRVLKLEAQVVDMQAKLQASQSECEAYRAKYHQKLKDYHEAVNSL